MRLQNARNLGGGTLLSAAAGTDGDAVYIFKNGATVKMLASGENRGTVCYGAAIVLPDGRVTAEGGKLIYDGK